MRRLFALFVIAIVFVCTPAHAAELPGTIVRGYEPPATRYGPGHRGIEFEAAPGSHVRAVTDGTVTFAGRVANRWYVSVRIDPGRIVTYAYLARIDVRRGQRVRAGQGVGTTYGRWHLGLRIGHDYADPMTLFSGPARVHLVPLKPTNRTG